jgi:hypothetical protein
MGTQRPPFDEDELEERREANEQSERKRRAAGQPLKLDPPVHARALRSMQGQYALGADNRVDWTR